MAGNMQSNTNTTPPIEAPKPPLAQAPGRQNGERAHVELAWVAIWQPSGLP